MARSRRNLRRFFDEPIANLDGSLRQEMGDEVRRILKKQGAAAILVSHDRSEAVSLADRIAVLHRPFAEQPYCVGQIDVPETVYARPASPEIAHLTGTAHVLTGIATGQTAQTEIGTVHLNRRWMGRLL